MNDSEERVQVDLRMVSRITFLPELLDLVCTATGMGFAAVARVTKERWIAAAVKDGIQFGLLPGDELPIASTICNEIREGRQPVIIDHVSHDACYKDHHTPATYGFESYISFPIIRRSGAFFGTLCAIDPRPAPLNTPPLVELFTTFASLIAHYLDGMQSLTPANLGKIDMYAAAELSNVRRDLAADAGDTSMRLRKLSLKLNQLLFALEPGGAFLS